MDSLNLQTAVDILEQLITSAAPADCPVLLGALERLKGQLWLRMQQAPSAATAPIMEPVKYLTVEEMVARFPISAKWLYRNKHRLPHSKASHKVLLFPERAITKWFESQKGA